MDKQAHFFSGYGLALSIALIASHYVPHLMSSVFGIGGAVFLGMIKEIYEKQYSDTRAADFFDLLSTASGGMLGAIFFLIFW